MLVIQIKTHSVGRLYSLPHFFILNKGKNSGKHLDAPCPNCFVLLAEDHNEQQFYFWISFGLWKSKGFNPFLKGSVIEFITLNDLRRLLKAEAERAGKQLPIFHRAIADMAAIEKQEKQLSKMLSLLAIAKIQIYRKFQHL